MMSEAVEDLMIVEMRAASLLSLLKAMEKDLPQGTTHSVVEAMRLKIENVIDDARGEMQELMRWPDEA